MRNRERGVLSVARRALWLALAGLVAGPVLAQGNAGLATGPIRWSGFGTLGLTHHDNETAGAIFSYSQRSPAEDGLSANLDSVLGLQADAQLAESTSATVQGVARAGDDLRPRLRMAYLRQGLGKDVAVRLGRIRSPLYLDSDVSEIGFAYLAARAAPPLYNVAGNYVPHVDGADLQWRHAIGPAALLLQAYAGSSKTRQVVNLPSDSEARVRFENIRGLALNVSLPSVSLRASRTWIGRFTLRSPQVDQLNAGVAQFAGALQGVAANPLLPPQAAQALLAQSAAIAGYNNVFDARPIYSSLGFDANVADLRVMGEWAEFDSRSRMVGKYRGFHAALGYPVGSFTPYIGLSRNTRVDDTLDTSAIAATGLDPALDAGLAQLRGALDQAALFTDLSTRSKLIGVRWDVRDSIAVKLQYDRFKTPSSTTPGIFAVPGLPFDNRVNLLSLSVDFVF